MAGVTRKRVVCAAEDEPCAATARELGTASLCLVDAMGAPERLRAHVEAARPAVSLQGESAIGIYAAGDGEQAPPLTIELPPMPPAARQPLLFAAATAHALGVGAEDIARGLLGASRPSPMPTRS